jgi:hypothetical protein
VQRANSLSALFLVFIAEKVWAGGGLATSQIDWWNSLFKTFEIICPENKNTYHENVQKAHQFKSHHTCKINCQ